MVTLDLPPFFNKEPSLMSGQQQNSQDRGPDPKSRVHDLLASGLGIFAMTLLCTFKWHVEKPAADYPFYKGPSIFPMVVLVIMAISSLPSIYRLIRPIEGSSWYLDGYGWPVRPAIVTLLMVLLFIIGIPIIGMEIVVAVFMALVFLILGYRKIGVNIVYPAIYTGIIVILFKYILKIWFPEPQILSLFGG